MVIDQVPNVALVVGADIHAEKSGSGIQPEHVRGGGSGPTRAVNKGALGLRHKALIG